MNCFQVLIPRIFQALASGMVDYSFYKWTGGRKWGLFLILTSWFWFYTSGRTLLQTLETVLVALALARFPFKEGRLSQYEKGKIRNFKLDRNHPDRNNKLKCFLPQTACIAIYCFRVIITYSIYNIKIAIFYSQ